MSNKIFRALFQERAEIFKHSFSSVSKELFYDDESNTLRHSAEFGSYRESIVRDFIKFITPTNLDIATGFIMTTEDDISTQCDVVVYDASTTPLYQGDRQRFFPIETTISIIEVKSKLSKKEFSGALNKLARIKMLSDNIKHPSIIKKHGAGIFDPINNPDDMISSILICDKLDFKLDNIHEEFDQIYDQSIERRHRHNMILSLKDGLIAYIDESEKISTPYTHIGTKIFEDSFFKPGDNSLAHLELFSSYMFLLTTNKTVYYPEFTKYL